MKKIKIFIVFFFIVIILTGCFSKENTVGSAPAGTSSVESSLSNVETTTTKPQKAPDPTSETTIQKETPPHNEPPNQDKPATSPTTSPKSQIKEIDGFVLLSSLDKDILIDLRYATTDNFTGKIVYPDNICVLRKNTAEKLVKANAQLKKLGYRIKVWDAYRPVYVQQIFWDMVRDNRFVANPKTGGSVHNKGCAVDVTLVNMEGNELTMPSKFDDFSPNAYRTNSNRTNEAKKNMDLLTEYMVDNGFTTIDTEWWHFEDADSKEYQITDINLKLFME